MPEQYNLREVVQKLTQVFPAIESLHRFGSRRYRTGSPRSDIDILVSVNRYIRPTELRQFSQEHGPALDLFLVDGGKAVNCANESRVEAASFDELTDKLDAIHFWDRAGGGAIEGADIDWEFNIPEAVDFMYTTMLSKQPFSWAWLSSAQKYFKTIESDGLLVSPYIGGSVSESTDFICELIRRLPLLPTQIVPKSKGVPIQMLNEYDLQNLFLICAKPWIPTLAREEVGASNYYY